VIMSFYGLSQIIGNSANAGYRVDATLGNSTYLAVYLLVHIFLCLFFWWKLVEKTGGLSRIFKVGATYIYSPIILLLFYVFYRTGTRGALLGLVGGIFVAAILVAIFEKKDILLKRLAIWAVIVVVALGGVFMASRNTSFVQNNPLLSRLARVTTIQGMSSEGRFMIWPMAWQGFKERPVLGWGQESFNYVFNKYYDPKMYNQEAWFDRTHNVVLDWLIAAGALGFLSYLSIFAVGLWLPWRRREVVLSTKTYKNNDSIGVQEKTFVRGFTLGERAIITALFIAYFIHNLFVFDNLVSYILFFTILAYIHTQEFTKPVARIHEFFDKIKMDSGVRDRLVAPIILALLAVTVYFVNWQPLQTNYNLIDAMILSNQGQTEDAFNSFKKALGGSQLGRPEVREQLMSLVSTLSRSNLPEEKKNEIAAFAFDEFKKQIEQTPNDARYYIFTGSMLDGIGAFDVARPYLEKAVQLSLNKQTIRMELINNYLNSGKKAEALKLAKETYNLEPDFENMGVVYAITLLYNKQRGEAEKILSSYNDPSLFTDERVLAGYAEAGAIDKVLSYYKDKAITDPQDLQSRYRLVQLYVSSGQRYKAIEEVESMIKAVPGFKTQGEQLIKQLQNK
jgi:O-antigen ligase